MKENSKIINSMVKVQLDSIRFPFCVTYLFAFQLGKYFSDNGNLYEG